MRSCSATSGRIAVFQRTIRCGPSARSLMPRSYSYRTGSTRSTPTSAALDRARETAACPAAPGVLLRAFGTTIDGADELQFAVPLVCWAFGGRAGLGCRPYSAITATGCSQATSRGIHGGGAKLPQVEGLLSSEHFSVDGTQIKAWASMKSFRRRDGNDHDSAPAAMPSATFTATNAATKPTPRRPIRMHAYRANRQATRPSSPIPAIC